jgi:hypothetical protein
MYGFDFSKEPRAIREAKEEGAIGVLSVMLSRQLQQELPETVRSRLTTLPLPVLKDLSSAFLDFNSLEKLEQWINLHSASVQ